MVEQARARIFMDTTGRKTGEWVLVLFIFHLDEMEERNTKGKVMPPKLEGKKMGVFATRSPHRFNPIGLSIWEVEEVGEGYLGVKGVDMVDGTPIVGVFGYEKKYLVGEGRLKIPEWLEETKDRVVKVEWSEKAAEMLDGEIDASDFF